MLPNVYKKAIATLCAGGVVVMPSDTIYGICARADDVRAVEKIYTVRGRQPQKPCIVMVRESGDVKRFAENISYDDMGFMRRIWKGDKELLHKLAITSRQSVSIVVPVSGEKNTHLHRGKKTLAFRVPHDRTKRSRLLKEVLKKTGPLIVPSANREGFLPAKTIADAREAFADTCDYYVAYGRALESTPSAIIAKEHGQWKRLR